MREVVLYGAIAVLLLYYLSRLVQEMFRRWNWHFWYKTFYLRSWHWKFLKWRKKTWSRITRGKLMCEKCTRKTDLQIHHIHYNSLGREKLSDLQIICKYCHRRGGGRIA